MGEAHRLFTVFTKEFGKVQLWAISARKSTSKLRGGLEQFYYSQLEFIEGKNRKVLVEATCLQRHGALRQNLQALRAAFKIAALLDSVVFAEERDEKIWDLLKQSFQMLEQGLPPQEVYSSFKRSFLKTAGYGTKQQTPITL